MHYITEAYIHAQRKWVSAPSQFLLKVVRLFSWLTMMDIRECTNSMRLIVSSFQVQFVMRTLFFIWSTNILPQIPDTRPSLFLWFDISDCCFRSEMYWHYAASQFWFPNPIFHRRVCTYFTGKLISVRHSLLRQQKTHDLLPQPTE